ncbi:MAG TPA: hypothetical protein VGP82_05150 [Ktedonobacterales bacterium]|jgi:hypothetical protein|nr:hypothetical protein [Ktedonobacterales bacterium]
MSPYRLLFFSWLGTGFGAFIGSVLGNAAGPSGLKAGAVAGGVVALLGVVAISKRLNWLPPGESIGAVIGGIGGFAVAILLTLTHMHTPIVPVLSCGLVGIGVLVGAGVARGWTRH